MIRKNQYISAGGISAFYLKYVFRIFFKIKYFAETSRRSISISVIKEVLKILLKISNHSILDMINIDR